MDGFIRPVVEPVESTSAINDRQIFLTACLLMSGLPPVDNQHVRSSCQSIWNGRGLYRVHYEIVVDYGRSIGWLPLQ